MHRFWDTIIKPVLEIIQPKTIVEIGSDKGHNTRHLLKYCRQYDAKLYVIDPKPKYDVSAWKEEYGELLVFYLALSLNAIPLVERLDVVLIDGDHNWYTVLNELKLIEKHCVKHYQPFPLIILHDIGWPYGRRDLYYNPETIPQAYRKPYQQKGMRPGSPELLETGGLNPHLYNSIYENNLQNGVLTAVEDFLNETEQSIDLIKVPVMHGIGILIPRQLKEQNKEFAEFIEALSLSSVVDNIMSRIEQARLTVEIDLEESSTALKNVEASYKGKVERLQGQVTDLQQLEAEFKNVEANYRGEVERLQEQVADLQQLEAEFKNVEANYRGEVERLQEQVADLQQLEAEFKNVEDSHRGEVERLQEQVADLQQLEAEFKKAEDSHRGKVERLQRQVADLQQQLVETKYALTNKDSKLKQYSQDVERLVRWIVQLDLLISSMVNANRWKLGNVFYTLYRRILFKPLDPPPQEHQSNIVKKFQEWRQSKERISTTQILPLEKKNNVNIFAQKTLKFEGSVSIIILNRNGASHLKNLFESFLIHNKYQNLEFIVVEHASNDNSLEVIRSFQDRIPINIVVCDTNHSFSYSNNRAAEQSNSEYLLFLNNDIIFQLDVIADLISYFREPTFGVVGAKLLYPLHDPKFPGAVQHAGIKFFEDTDNRFYRPYNLGMKPDNDTSLELTEIVPAVTGAVMACRRREFLSIGGFCEEYLYGYEDVDLCLTYLSKLKKISISANELTLIHDESSTQRLDLPENIRKRRQNNQVVLQKRYGYALRKTLWQDLITGGEFWSNNDLVVAFAVTEAHEGAKVGDYFTALELASACAVQHSWEIRFLARDQDWYNVDGIDVLIVMVDAYDLSKVHHAKPGLIKIAWLRNWFDRWAKRPWFDDYHIYLCSSNKGNDFLKEHGKAAHTFRIATNEKRFAPSNKQWKFSSDYCFPGSYWNANRDIEEMLKPERLRYKFALYGQGWDKHEKFRPYWKGFIPYKKIPHIYSSTKIVIDDANHVTKPWGSLNSRVFDALASGALVITNNIKGSDEVFGGKLPTYKTSEELESLLELYLSNEKARQALVKQLREIVLENHIYANRATQLQSVLADFCSKKFRISIKAPVPKMEEAREWGDYHFALALKRSFVKLGHYVRIDILPDWNTQLGFGDDVVFVLRGLSRYEPKPDHINIMWNISHPDKISYEEYDQYDHVFVASYQYADELKTKVSTPVTALLQCTDPKLFYAEIAEDVPEEELLFVGNSRKQFRTVVKDAIEADLPISVYGTRWENIIGSEYIKSTHIENTKLRQYYSKCKILLNDHWPIMQNKGFISNRLFDAGACGSFIISDEISGATELFGDALVTYRGSSNLKQLVEHFLANDAERKAYGEKLRDIVLPEHTFDNRVVSILRVIEKLNQRRLIDLPTWLTDKTKLRALLKGFARQ